MTARTEERGELCFDSFVLGRLSLSLAKTGPGSCGSLWGRMFAPAIRIYIENLATRQQSSPGPQPERKRKRPDASKRNKATIAPSLQEALGPRKIRPVLPPSHLTPCKMYTASRRYTLICSWTLRNDCAFFSGAPLFASRAINCAREGKLSSLEAKLQFSAESWKKFPR